MAPRYRPVPTDWTALHRHRSIESNGEDAGRVAMFESPQQIFFACFPNPFNPATTITFSLPHESFIKVVVFDLTGRQVRILAAQHFSAGEHRVPFDGSALSSGIYFLRMEAGAAVRTQKIVLLR